MPGACRLGDRSKAPIDTHGCPACLHTNVQGPAITASPNVFVNGAPALRIGDGGIHAACCFTNTWKVIQGSGQVFVNGQALVRKGDTTLHCGGIGKMIDASENVIDASAEGASLLPQINEWLERITENGKAQLLYILSSPVVGNLYYTLGELGKLYNPECHGAEYFKHLAKCLPSKPPGEPDEPPPQHPVPVEPSQPTVPSSDIGPSVGDYILGGAAGILGLAAAATGQPEAAIPLEGAAAAKLAGG